MVTTNIQPQAATKPNARRALLDLWMSYYKCSQAEALQDINQQLHAPLPSATETAVTQLLNQMQMLAEPAGPQSPAAIQAAAQPAAAPLAAPVIPPAMPPEMPFSANVTTIDSNGYEWQHTTRAFTAAEHTDNCQMLILRLIAQGHKPRIGNRYEPVAPAPAARTTENDEEEKEEKRADWCPIHSCKMLKREANGESWFSHKAEDEDGDEYWCKGGKGKKGKGK